MWIEGRVVIAAALGGLLGCVAPEPTSTYKKGTPFDELTLQNLIRWPSGKEYLEGTGSAWAPDEVKDTTERRKRSREEAATQAQKQLIGQLSQLVPKSRIPELLRRAEVSQIQYTYDDACALTLRIPKEAVVGQKPVE